MASGSQNMTTYNARTVTGSNSAASPAGALLLSGAGRANDATGDTWIFFDSCSDTSTPWGIKHDQANNKIHIYGNNTDSVWTRMNTGDTYILGKVGIGYDPETSENLYKLYVNGSSLYTGRLYGNTGNGLEVQSLNTGNWKEGIRIYNASDNYSVLCLCNNDLSDLLSLVHSGSAHSYYIDIENDGTYSKINIPSKHSGTMALTDGYGASGTWGISITGNAGTATTWQTARTLTVGNKGQSVNGSANVSWTLNDILYNATTIGTNTSWDQTGPSVYYVASSAAFTGTNHPGNNSEIMPYTYGQLIVSRAGSGGVLQVYAPHTGSGGAVNAGLRYRTGWNSGGWQAWSTLLDDKLWRKYIFCNKNINRSQLTVSDSGWAVVPSGAIDIFGLAFKDTALSNDTGDIRMWLQDKTTLHIQIDGAFHASQGFVGNVTGNCSGSAGSVAWANVSSKPATATRWPAWSEVTSKPSTFSPSAHTDHTQIELRPGSTSAGHGGFIDFHFNNSSADYTSRIIEWSSGTLTVYTNLSATKIYNAVWNDFAEYRESDIYEGGRVLVSNGSGKLVLSTERLQPTAHVISDTFGCSVGQSDSAKTPIGVAGRVLAYTYQDRNNYKVGDAVCAAPNGTIDIMTREEIIQYPDRIIGIVDEIPNYEIWHQVSTQYDGNGNYGGHHEAEVEVKNRIWIYVR